MASADLSEELECPVCLTIYTDPVSLRCGHNFCRVCIDRVLDSQEGSAGYSCPECREKYKERPGLHRNIALRNIAGRFLTTQPDQEETGVHCTYCIHSPVPAVMSCLHCDASMCDNHLRVHSKAPEHVLCAPTTSPETRKCSVHKKILEYYCTEDASCVCVTCTLAGEHRGHQVETLQEASEKKKKKLRNDLQTLMAETEEAEKRVQSLEERRRKAQEKADGETERVTALFRDLRRRLEELERRVLSDITRQAEMMSQSYDDIIRQLEMKKAELSRKMRHIEELCHMTDPLTVLQESDTGDLCDTEDRHDKQLHDGGDLDVAGISHILHTGLADIMSGVIVQKHTDTQATPPLSRPRPHPSPTAQHTQAYPHSSTEDKVPVTAKLSRPCCPHPTPTAQHTQPMPPLSRPRPHSFPTAQHTQAYPHFSTEDKVPVTAKLFRPRPHPSPTAQHTQAYPHSSIEDKVPITAKLSRPHPQPPPTAQHTQAYPHSSTEDKAPVTATLSRKRPHPSPTAQHTQAYSHSSTDDKAPVTAKLSRPHPQPSPTAQHTQAYPHSSTEDKVPITAKLSRPHPQPSPTTQHAQRQVGRTHIGAAQQTSGQPVYADILLDVTTAGDNLNISDDRKTASYSPGQNRPDTAERFQWPQVLSSRSFSSGRHYWEVDVGRSDGWIVGMCYPSIARRGGQSWIGDNNKSWGLYRGGNRYSVRHDRKEIQLHEIPSDRVRISLDYEAGQISFYALCDPIRHLHTFTATFTEPLHAGLYVRGGCIKISGGSQGRLSLWFPLLLPAMASADLSEELECPVCLTIYTDPVSLRCGHNFCRVCIDRVLDSQEGSAGYSCPECREKYKERPGLHRNIALRNIAERFLSTQPDQEEAGVHCTYCIHSPVPAVMSCLLCDASLCDNHLRVHSKVPEHVLCAPTTSPETRKCSVHKKILEYYCTEDAACVCVTCTLAGEHQGHQVETLQEASEKKKKKLRNDLQTLMAETQEAEKRVQSQEERRRKAQEKAAGEAERVTALFRDLRRRLEELEKRVLSDIMRQAEMMSQSYDDIIRQLEIKKAELSRKMRHIEELCHMTDPLTVLQESDTGDLCDMEDRHDKQLHDGGDLDVAGISHTLHTGLADIMSEVIVQKHTDTQATPPLYRLCPQTSPTAQHTQATHPLSRPRPHPSPTAQHTQATPPLSRPRPQSSPTAQHTQAYPHSSTEDKVPITAKLSRPRPHPSPTTQHTQRQAGGTHIGAAQQTSGLPVYADILLDVNTAGNWLHISDDRKTASRLLIVQNRPDTAERFQEYPQVLSSRSFSSGRHYWEVDVGGSDYCRVGMCYPSMARRGGEQSGIGDNNKSWGLCRKGGLYDHYSVRHDREEIQSPDGIRSDKVRRVRICLDYEAGQISFYALCDPIRHLHTFTATFTEPLHAALYVWRGCIKISGRSQGV
ncbi:uncharacterized protein [Hyperolius riggenbachi]|uniref:uncharacterized protein n=1 Tax=Hyperolius riggenbachi TaxID=752182 RepID=UPI0035A2E021